MGVISDRVKMCRAEEHPLILARMPSGYAVLNDNQPEAIAGCCVLLPDPVVPSVNDLDAKARARFMADFLLLGDAVLAATGAERINYLILCNMAPELHAHVIPRFAREDPAKRRLGPFEAYDFGSSAKCEPDEAHCELLGRIRSEIEARLGAR
ncbi:MAG: hypothetical protein KDA31_01210 [Phycisphaerales bacterium]|nr:hypothetical protein [Phycisphaerales bacterium]MCB9836959.1 hypothetical protein [Phycisphaera sp.]